MSDDPFPRVVCTYGDLCELERRWHAFPDLLAACEAAYARLNGNAWHDKLAAQLRAAIRKAKGETT